MNSATGVSAGLSSRTKHITAMIICSCDGTAWQASMYDAATFEALNALAFKERSGAEIIPRLDNLTIQ